MDELQYREMQDEDDVAGYLKLHDTHWPHVSLEFWREWTKTEEVTISLALKNNEVVGGIPFHIREFRIRPDVTIKAAFEFSVLVREDLRDRGVGSKMMDTAKDFLKGRADAMMVYRGGELTPGYNFYAKNKHYDITYLRPRVLRKARDAKGNNVEITDITELYGREDDVLRVFKSAFEGFGGYPERYPGYWKRALNSLIYQEIPQEFKFLYVEEGGVLRGYAIIGKRSRSNVISILELATLNGEKKPATQLVNCIAEFAVRNNCEVRIHSPDFSLYSDVLREAGFIGIPRSRSSMMIMAYIIDPNSLAKKVWRENENLRNVKVSAWSPSRRVILHESEASTPSKEITLEMKDDILTRLLLSRLDLVSAVKQEMVTVVGGDMNDIRDIAYSLPYTPWEHHDIDYI